MFIYNHNTNIDTQLNEWNKFNQFNRTFNQSSNQPFSQSSNTNQNNYDNNYQTSNDKSKMDVDNEHAKINNQINNQISNCSNCHKFKNIIDNKNKEINDSICIIEDLHQQIEDLFKEYMSHITPIANYNNSYINIRRITRRIRRH